MTKSWLPLAAIVIVLLALSCGVDVDPPLPTPPFDCSLALSVDEAWEAATRGDFDGTGSVFDVEVVTGRVFDVGEGEDWIGGGGEPATLSIDGPTGSRSLSIWVDSKVDVERYRGRAICVRGDVSLLPNGQPFIMGVSPRDIGVLD